MAVRIQLRRDTAANWVSSNPTLAQGEIGIETDTVKVKVGDGSTNWINLAYFPNITGAVVGTTDAQTLTSKTLTAPTIDNGIENYPLLKAPLEKATVSATAATGTIAFDAKTQAVLYYTTNASGNFTLNVRGDAGSTLASMLAVGQAITVVFLNTNGATAYYGNAFQIDGFAVTPKWVSGAAPTAGNASSIDAYSLTIIKTAATPTYTVLATLTKFA